MGADMYWHWPTSFGYVVIDDQSDEREENDALVGWRNQELKNEYGTHSLKKLYCYRCRSAMCVHINTIKDENV